MLYRQAQQLTCRPQKATTTLHEGTVCATSG
jgi:hypothetical protein